MREVRFRAWVKSNNFPDGVMFLPESDPLVWHSMQPAEHSFLLNLHGDLLDVVHHEGTKHGIAWARIGWSWDLMQSTGMKDADGVEIWEGDILDFEEKEWGAPEFKSVVTWDENNACWNFGGGVVSDLSAYRRVVGNIHQNPDMVEVVE